LKSDLKGSHGIGHCEGSYDAVFSASSLEEAIAIELNQEALSLHDKLSIFVINAYLFLANLLVGLLGRIWFAREPVTPASIVVYTVGTLGDNVLMLPAVAALRRYYPDAKLTVVTNCDGFSAYPATQVWGGNPCVDKLITFPTHPVQRQGFGFRIDKSGLENMNCDLFVNLSPFGNREIIFARSLGAKKTVGFRLNSYNRRVVFNRVQHHFVQNEARRPREVLALLGIEPIEKTDLLTHDAVAKANVEKLLRELGIPLGASPLVVLNPGSKLAASRWPAQRFGEFAAWLAETQGAYVVVNGSEGEQSVCDEVVRASGGKAASLAGRLPIRELIELLRLSFACVSNNTGTMTLAAMVSIPLIVLSSTRFSPTFYMPISDRMIWLFSFSEGSYSYNDLGGTSKDMLNIGVNDLSEAYSCLMRRGLEMDLRSLQDNWNKLGKEDPL
jgi:heptosyltransferase-3